MHKHMGRFNWTNSEKTTGGRYMFSNMGLEEAE